MMTGFQGGASKWWLAGTFTGIGVLAVVLRQRRGFGVANIALGVFMALDEVVAIRVIPPRRMAIYGLSWYS